MYFLSGLIGYCCCFNQVPQKMMKFIEEHKTNVLPLRWFANLCEKPAHYNLVMALHYSDHDDYGIKYKLHAIVSNWLYRPYLKWGTVYKADFNDH